MADQDIIDEGKLSWTVDKNIIPHLSRGLYKNFSRAVKEMVSNSYDAEAKEVKIKLDLANRRIIIKDDGKGMSFDEIESKLLKIGKSTSKKDQTIGLGRKRIGQFGIGFLASFPYCDTIRLITKKVGQTYSTEIERR